MAGCVEPSLTKMREETRGGGTSGTSGSCSGSGTTI